MFLLNIFHLHTFVIIYHPPNFSPLKRPLQPHACRGGDIHAAAIAGDVQAVRKIQKAKPHSVHAFDESGFLDIKWEQMRMILGMADVCLNLALG